MTEAMTPEELKEYEARVKCVCPQWCLDTPPEDMSRHCWDDCHRYCPQHGEGFLQRIDEWKLVLALKQAWAERDEATRVECEKWTRMCDGSFSVMSCHRAWALGRLAALAEKDAMGLAREVAGHADEMAAAITPEERTRAGRAWEAFLSAHLELASE